jgi:predicted Zn-dependent peptidase
MRETLLVIVLAFAGACGDKVKESSFALANGLKVEVVAAPHAEKVAVLMSYEIGLDYDPPGRSGLANLLGRLLPTCAAPGRPVRTREELAARYGSSLRVQSGNDHLTVAVTVPTGWLDEELDDFAARMGALEIEEADLERERPALLLELARSRGGDAGLAAAGFAAEAIRPTRGGWRGGVPVEIARITPEEAESHWIDHGKPANARLVIVGDVDAARVRARVEAAFGRIPAGAPATRRPPAASRVTGTLVMGDAPSVVALAVGAPAPSEADYAPFVVLAARLSGGVHPWKAAYPPFGDVLLVTGAVKPDERPDDAAARIHQEVTWLLAAKPTASELRAAEAAYGLSWEAEVCAHDPAAVAWLKARAAQLRVDGRALAQALEAVGPAQLADAARRFDKDRVAAVVAGGAIPAP